MGEYDEVRAERKREREWADEDAKHWKVRPKPVSLPRRLARRLRAWWFTRGQREPGER